MWVYVIKVYSGYQSRPVWSLDSVFPPAGNEEAKNLLISRERILTGLSRAAERETKVRGVISPHSAGCVSVHSGCVCVCM